MGKKLFAATALAALVGTGGPVLAEEPLKVGFLATLEGTYTVLGEDGLRGFKVALEEIKSTAGGRPIEVIIAATDASPDSAIRAVRKVVEQDGVDIVIGPLSGSEGIALRDYSKTQPGVTFINGISGAQETTYVTPSENFFRFNMDGAQWSAGLGEYVFKEKGYETVATIGEDYSFIYTQVFGFALEYCRAGGEITERFWVPLGTKDFGSIIAALPDDVDAIYLGLGGGDAVNFLNQYQQAGGEANLIGGTIMVDGTVLNSKGSAKAALVGVPSSGPQADDWDNPNWQKFVKAYQDLFPPEERFPSPALMATGYYNATIAMKRCMDEVNGDLSDGHKAFRQCLSTLVMEDAPNGPISLDENRQAIGTNFLTEVVENADGTLSNKLIKVIEGVNQTMGIDKDAFASIGLPSRENPVCKKNTDVLKTAARAAPPGLPRLAHAARIAGMTLINYLTRIHFADGVLEEALRAELELQGRRRPLIIAEDGQLGGAIAERFFSSFPIRTRAEVVTAAAPVATEETARAIAASYVDAECDVLIAFGSSRVIDLAKTARICIAHDEPIADLASDEGGAQHISPDLQELVAVPNVVGFSSAVSEHARVRLVSGRQALFSSRHLIPSVTICDPTLTLGSSPGASASAAAGILSRGIEGYLSRAYNPPADGLALDGLSRMVGSLDQVLGGGDLDAWREFMAGGLNTTLSLQKGLTALDAINSALAATTGFDGDANAVGRLLLPGLVERYGEAASAKLPRLRQTLRLGRDRPLAEGVSELMGQFPLPTSLSSLGIRADDLPEVAEIAARDRAIDNGPRPLRADDVLAILCAVY